jgi:hypothetical protein
MPLINQFSNEQINEFKNEFNLTEGEEIDTEGFILLENGHFLLLESGGKIPLEIAS